MKIMKIFIQVYTLFLKLYKYHADFHIGLQNYVLHLHSHYPTMYDNHGNLTHIGCFGQEDLIGYLSSNHHGTRFYGDLITYYYNIDFSIHNKRTLVQISDGPMDRSNQNPSEHGGANELHFDLCGICDNINNCFTIYRRFIIRQQIYHSLIYNKRQTSKSYFVQYLFNNDINEQRFGIINYFFTYLTQAFAVVQYYPRRSLYSDCFKQSIYFSLLKNPLDSLFFVLEKHHLQTDIVNVDWISSHCIVIEMENSLFVTPVSSYNEHD